MSFVQAYQFTVPYEGGYVVDDGGPTMHGVTQAVYDAYRTAHKWPTQWVKMISNFETHDIYLSQYWGPSSAQDLPTMSGIVHFDWSVDHGVEGAIKTMQEVLGVADDGIIGPITLAAMRAVNDTEFSGRYLDKRRLIYREIAANNPDDEQYLDGWLNRCDELQNYITRL